MKCGYVALIGRPNVGKSTLMNRLLGQKISITSRKPQTTRHRILGIATDDTAQIIYVDTPGMHGDQKKALNRTLNRTADSALLGVNAVVWLLDSPAWQDYDAEILQKLRHAGAPVILAVNKIDRLAYKEALLHFFDEARQRFPFAHLIPISARNGTNLPALRAALLELLPESAPLYDPEWVTDRPERFLAAELIREKLMRRLGQELPYALTVVIERYEEQEHLVKIYATIWVERDSQKNIVIGKQGAVLKQVGSDARRDIEALIGHQVFLQLWVKTQKGWADNERLLHSLGFGA